MKILSDKKLKALMGIVKKINSSQELDATLSLIMDEAKKIIPSESSSLMLIDEETKELYFCLVTGEKSDEVKMVRIPPGRGIAGMVVSTGKAIISNDAENDRLIFKDVDQQTEITTRNLICVPLIMKGHTLGVLEVINRIGATGYSDSDLALLKSISDFAAVAINNRHLYEKMKRRAYEASALHRLSTSINYCNSVDELLGDNIAIVAEVMEAKRVSILTRMGKDFKFRAGIGFNTDRVRNQKVVVSNILEYMIKTDRSVFSTNINEDDRFGMNNDQRYRKLSFIVVPMKIRNKLVACLCVTERSRKQPYQHADQLLLDMLAQQIVENYSHFHLTEEFRKKQIMEAELSITARIQQDIIPRDFPSDGHFDIAACNLPAKIIGGDFYDFIPLGEGKFGVIIADVSGKGIPAGLFMAISRSVIRVHFTSGKGPATIMSLSNRRLHEDSSTCMFVTVFCCIIDTIRKEITYASAGHPNQYLVSSGKHEVKIMNAPGKPLGVLAYTDYLERKIVYDRGDLMALYTDGVTEAMNRNGEQYGDGRLKKLLMDKAIKKMESREIMELILKYIEQFRGDAEQSDDITLMIVKFLS